MSLKALNLEQELPQNRIDVGLQDGEAVITLSSYTEVIGWTTQKTMRVDAAQLDDLHRQIAAARCRLKASADPDKKSSATVIEFPTI